MDTTCDQQTMHHSPIEESRRERRYKRLAEAQLPPWSPAAIRNEFAQTLAHVSLFRKDDKCARDFHGVEWNDGDLNLLNELELLQRLCTYHSEIDMRRVWDKIAGSEVKNSNLTWGLQTPDDQVGLVLSMIVNCVRRFEKIPKVTPAERIKKISKTIGAVSKALDAIRSDPWASALSPFLVSSYFGLRNIEMRAQNGESLRRYDQVPHLAISPKYDDVDRDVGDECDWDSLPAGNRYAWLASALEDTSVEDILEFTARSLAATMSTPAEIQHPGRGDGGLVPYLIREISALMQMLYKQPLDDTVALLVSAIANLPEPLDRSGVRPYLRAARKNLGKQSLEGF